MSIRIDHGYRLSTTDITGFLTDVEARIGPVRDRLDVTLYATIVADLIDRADHEHPVPELDGHSSLADAALAEVHRHVTTGAPASTLHHPHSFDLDYGQPPDNDAPDNDAPDTFFVLVHAQRPDYYDALTSAPGLTPFPYWNHVDPPDGLTTAQWEQRRAAWEWLISAARISDVMTRYTYRPDPAPDETLLADPVLVLEHQPSRADRARRLAEHTALTEHFAGATNMADRMGEVFTVLTSPHVTDLTATYLRSLRTLTDADLTRRP